ncbi:Zn-ribbon domain-containing OB-fold protein [Halorarius halobius]|uniref:Zn-ribbon domain-containing OB-fold protein n=1 Tax=Halorarius halobius TaxID=2962671 RepID=UPI0020CF11E0|nr:zinc ribbon domain-containing protein [Halorarius halobius]
MSETQELPETLRYNDWAQAVTEGRLLGQECADCGNVEGTPKGACSACGSRALDTVELPTTGEVYTETTIQVPPVQFETRGYQVVVVEVGEARVMGRVEDGGVAIGDEVTLSGYVDTDDDHPGPVFEPT